MDTAPVEVVAPLEVPAGAAPVPLTADGQEYIAYSMEQAEQLEKRLTALRGNTEIARENAQALSAMNAERLALIEAGRATERRSNFLEQRLYDRSRELDTEQRTHMIDNLVHRLLLIIGVAVSAL